MQIQTIEYSGTNLGPFKEAVEYARSVRSNAVPDINAVQIRVYAREPERFHEAMGPNTLRIGVAGAYDARDDEKQTVQQAVKSLIQAFPQYLKDYPQLGDMKLVFVSGGAAGADQAATTAALDGKYTVLTIRPDPYDNYKSVATTKFGYKPQYLPENNPHHIYIQTELTTWTQPKSRGDARSILSARDPIIQKLSHAYILGPLRDSLSSTTDTLRRILENADPDDRFPTRHIMLVHSKRNKSSLDALAAMIQKLNDPLRIYNPQQLDPNDPLRILKILLAGGTKRLLKQQGKLGNL